jgi:hypothetical protein
VYSNNITFEVKINIMGTNKNKKTSEPRMVVERERERER